MEDESRTRGTPTRIVKVEVDNETEIIVEARMLPGETESDVSDRLQRFDKVTAAIERVSYALTRAWEHSGPSRASVEFNLEFACSLNKKGRSLVLNRAKPHGGNPCSRPIIGQLDN